MKTIEIRTQFLEYFEARGHEKISSSSLVPGNDPTLLFTNSGMVQFKDIFLGNQLPSKPRAVTAQRCVRAGGKHNDLENVGYTARHHTFFEMLGNFSFGDYFKAEAIYYAWELLTKEFSLPPEKLWVTVYEEDEETAQIWLKDIKIPENQFSRIGARDNFWAMGDTGPCGPCSEIFYDHGPGVAGGPPGSAGQDGDRFVEIWNLVFMQFERSSEGSLEPLPKPSVDTGMGLERIAAVLQSVHSNYEIDLFQNLLTAAAELLAVKDTQHKSLRVIADHIRSSAFLMVDGVIPSNEGRGYVLRRIIRRAVRHGYQLGARMPFMHRLLPPLINEMGAAYPELVEKQGHIAHLLELENEKFAATLEQGLKILDREIANLSGDIIPGGVVFRLYDTFGFPPDLTADIAREHNLSIDTEVFEHAMKEQRARARAASQFVQDDKVVSRKMLAGVGASEFVGYQRGQHKAEIIALFAEQKPVVELCEGVQGIVVLKATPFYPEGGGQVGDSGQIHFADAIFTVEDTQYISDKIIGHIGTVSQGTISKGEQGDAQIATDLRHACANNHSTTHLLHRALKTVLGVHVHQKGSLVKPEYLRFDFAHPKVVSSDELGEIEQLVNRNIRDNVLVKTDLMSLEEAKVAGAEALFGEKYDSQVRVVRIGESFELCGGTHVAQSGTIGVFKIISESSVAAGVRRIEAVTGAYAEEWIRQQLAHLSKAVALIKSSPEQLGNRLQALLDGQRKQHKQIEALNVQLAAYGGGAQVDEINGVKVVAVRQNEADAKTMRSIIDRWKQKLESGIVLVAGEHENKVVMIVGITSDLAIQYHAGRLMAALTPVVNGHGGGQAEFAQGGGSRVASVDQLVPVMHRWVAETQN